MIVYYKSLGDAITNGNIKLVSLK